MLQDVLLKWNAVEVDAMTVYSDMFSLGDGVIQKEKHESYNMQGNPLGYWKNRGHKKGHYRIMFDDTFERTLKELQEADFAIMNGIAYFGRRNTQANANKMFSLIFDLDGVTDVTLNNFMSGALVADAYPVPNYVILSGHGVHLYYLFEEPVPLYPNIKVQLKNLKYGLIEKMWNSYTSTEDRIQFQGINQGFRVIGGKTKIEGVKVRAFRVNTHPFTLGQLGEYVLEEYRVNEKDLYRDSKITLEQARKKYPEWYERRVINGDESQGHWICKPDLYEWWKRQIKLGATYHHRYFNVMCLAIYAVKSGISKKQLRKDARELIPFLTAINPDYPFTKEDMESALECYDERFIRFPIDDISRLSAIPIQKNKRNGRSREAHIKALNFMRVFARDELGEDSYKNNGRKSKKSVVKEWRILNPEGTKADCIKETGLSKPTVYKWWNAKG